MWLSTTFVILAVSLALAPHSRGQSSPKGSPEKAAVASGPGDAIKGRAVYNRNCSICHFTKATGKKIGPGLKDLYKRPKFADGKKVDDANLRGWIESGGKNMPPFKNTIRPDEITDLIAYIRTL